MLECDWKGIFALGFMFGGLLAGWIIVIFEAIEKEKQGSS